MASATDDLATRVEYQMENPKIKGTKAYDLYERYKRSQTLAQAKKNGARIGDIKWDQEKGYLRILTKGTRRPRASI